MKNINLDIKITKLIARGINFNDAGHPVAIPPTYQIDLTVDDGVPAGKITLYVNNPADGAKAAGDAIGVAVANAIRQLTNE